MSADVVFVEIPSGSRNKYEYDQELGGIVLDRRLFTAMAYPADYGFVEGTLAEDGDQEAPEADRATLIRRLSLDLLEDALARRHAQVERYRRRLADCPGLSWQLVPPECVHGYKDLAVRFRKPEQRVAAEGGTGADV